MRVDSDDLLVRDRINLIAQTVQSNGGYIHPELVVHQRGASLWMSLPRAVNPHLVKPDGEPLDAPHPDAAPLLIIPDDLFIPVTDLDWEPHDEYLRYRGETGHLSVAQRTILDAMVDLFNAVDKVRVIGQGYPLQALSQDPELLALIREARPAFLREGGESDTASPALRVVGSRLSRTMGEGEEGPTGYFMPMIDMLNHHPFGSRYRRTDSAQWRIDVHHPSDSDQVFVRYNRADALGVALRLGYFEPATRHVASVRCEVDVPTLGPVRVRGVGAGWRRLPAPQLTIDDQQGWVLSQLMFEPARIHALTSLLELPLQVAAPGRAPGEVKSDVVVLLSEILAANVAFYQRLRGLCLTSPEPPADGRLRPLFADVSAHQLALLDRATTLLRP